MKPSANLENISFCIQVTSQKRKMRVAYLPKKEISKKHNPMAGYQSMYLMHLAGLTGTRNGLSVGAQDFVLLI